jgi:hypothetical protein
MPVMKATNSQLPCLPTLRSGLVEDQGCLSSLMRWLRVPSNFCSIHMKMLVQTVCGQV